MNETLLLHIGEAIALGLIVAVLLRLFRAVTPVRRVGASLTLIAVLLGLDLIVTGSGLAGEETVTRIIGSIAIMAAVNAGLQVLDGVLWQGLLMRRRQMPVPRLLIDLFNLMVLLVVAVLVLNSVFKVDLSALLNRIAKRLQTKPSSLSHNGVCLASKSHYGRTRWLHTRLYSNCHARYAGGCTA